jgi:hypothetical protein
VSEKKKKVSAPTIAAILVLAPLVVVVVSPAPCLHRPDSVVFVLVWRPTPPVFCSSWALVPIPGSSWSWWPTPPVPGSSRLVVVPIARRRLALAGRGRPWPTHPCSPCHGSWHAYPPIPGPSCVLVPDPASWWVTDVERREAGSSCGPGRSRGGGWGRPSSRW